MKRIIVFWLVLFFPIIVLATEYENLSINIKLNVNDDFIVLTRGNLDNNPNLETLDITKEDLLSIMDENNIYFDIIKKDFSYEILVVVPDNTTSFSSLSEASSKDLEELKNVIIEETGETLPIVYKNNYSFIVVDYFDESGYYNNNYYTVINHRGYNIQLQKDDEITENDKKELKEIIDSIEFTNIDKLDENNKPTHKNNFNFKIILYGVIIGLIAGLVTYYVGIKLKKKKGKK